MRTPPPAALALVKISEGFAASRAADPVGVPQIGYGHKLLPGGPLWNATISEAAAEDLAETDLAKGAAQLSASLGPDIIAKLTDGQYAALLDFVFNEGIGHFNASTLCHLIQNGYMASAPDEFGKWVYAGSPPVVLPGLVKRRAAERALWLS